MSHPPQHKGGHGPHRGPHLHVGADGRPSHGNGHHHPAGTMGVEFWDTRYREVHHGDRPPHATLVAMAERLSPGDALDLGCGIGSDARWLAARGWKVDAFDFSNVALDQAREMDRDGAVSWQRVDLEHWKPTGAKQYDFVSSHFLHLPEAARKPLFESLLRVVKPGGTVLFVTHHPEELTMRSAHAPADVIVFALEEFEAAFPKEHWDIVSLEKVSRQESFHGEGIQASDTRVEVRRKGRA